MKTATELAHRIERGIETPTGRYDWASKVEVKAYVDRKDAELQAAMLSGINALNASLLALQGRIAQIETPWWKRLTQRFRGIA